MAYTPKNDATDTKNKTQKSPVFFFFVPMIIFFANIGEKQKTPKYLLDNKSTNLDGSKIFPLIMFKLRA